MTTTTPRPTTALEEMRLRGLYGRRLVGVTPQPGGIRAEVALIPFADEGDARRPVILSQEPLSTQTIFTNVPNRPPEELAGQTTAPEQRITLDVRVLAPRIVRVRLGTAQALEEPRDFSMLAPDALARLDSPTTAVSLEETHDAVSASIAGITLRLRRDPFGLALACASVPGATVETPLDDRDVHGLLCTPPPGIALAPDGERRALWTWALTPDERLYGLGERFTRLDQRGERITLWDTDAWGTTTESSYKYVPFLHSSRGYGLFFHTPTPLTLQLGTPSLRAARALAGEAALDLFVVFGSSPKALLSEYTRLTGRATMPPRWAFGVWLSRCRYQSRAEVEAVAKRARAEDIPCDVLHLDPAWLASPNLSCDFVANDEAFPDLAGMVRELGERGFKVSLWELPYVSARAARYQEAAERGYFLRDASGAPICADFGRPPADGFIRAPLDFTNPEARAWWQDQHRPWLRAGVAVFKTDFGEGVPLDAHAHNGMTGYELHNLYPLLYNAAVHEVITQETGRPGMVWGRSGWAGTQRFPAQWGGDPKTDAWAMAASLRGGLNMALSAPGIWAHDIGGFYGPPPSPELYIRWAQFGLLSPLARAHGTTPREPWEFGAEALAIFRRYAKLRTRLAPYLYSTAWEAHAYGWPVLRPLLLEFPDDPVSVTIDDAYLLGPSLLVAPIFSESRKPVARHIYLPEGEWYDYWTGERVQGGRTVTRHAPLDTLPLYVRAGALLPLGPERAYVGDDPSESLTLDIYPGAGAESEAHIVWDATGTSTSLRLMREGDEYRLEISGERAVEWHARWHLPSGTVEEALGNAASLVALRRGG